MPEKQHNERRGSYTLLGRISMSLLTAKIIKKKRADKMP
jgi:hypothetical protein